MTTQTPITAKIEKWLWICIKFFTKFWLWFRVQKKNADSCQSQLRHSGSMATCGVDHWPTFTGILSPMDESFECKIKKTKNVLNETSRAQQRWSRSPCQAKFLTSRHVHMHRVIFYIQKTLAEKTDDKGSGLVFR